MLIKSLQEVFSPWKTETSSLPDQRVQLAEGNHQLIIYLEDLFLNHHLG